MKKLLTIASLMVGMGWTLPVEAQAKPVYMAAIGGKCQKLILGDFNVTSTCVEVIYNTVYNDGRFVYTSGFKTEGVLTPISFSGTAPKNLNSNQYVLTVDTVSTLDERNEVVRSRAVGTCSIDGNFTKQKTTYKCVVKDQSGPIFNFEFQSDPKLLKYL